MKSLILALAFLFIGTAESSDSKVNLDEVACETWATFQPCGESSKFYLCQDGRSLENLIDAAEYFSEVKCN